MKQIDLDDLPPRVANTLEGLQADETLLLVRGGGVVARLKVAAAPAPVVSDTIEPEQGMAEVMAQFNAMIHDEF